jgi:translation elongation factor EF-4
MSYSPTGSIDKPLRALLFDSWFDTYVGVVCMLAVVDGVLKKGEQGMKVNRILHELILLKAIK